MCSQLMKIQLTNENGVLICSLITKTGNGLTIEKLCNMSTYNEKILEIRIATVYHFSTERSSTGPYKYGPKSCLIET